jgi:hypothetical protein
MQFRKVIALQLHNLWNTTYILWAAVFTVLKHIRTNCERHLLASSCLSVFLSVRPSVRMYQRGPLDGFSWNLIVRFSKKICRKTPNFVKIEQKYRALCTNPVSPRRTYWTAWPLKIGPMHCSETSVKDYSSWYSKREQISSTSRRKP